MDRIAASVTAAIAACAAGCYSPVPTCQEEVTNAPVAIHRLTPGAGDVFVADGKAYASCHDFCARQPNVTHVRSCSPPEPRSAPGVSGVAYWQVSCDVDTMICEQAAIVTMGSGRPFGGFRRARAIASPGAWLAEMARLEAASVIAFDRLARELEAHRAPRALIAAARSARRDEIRHARIARTLARRYGEAVPDVMAVPLSVRDLRVVAEENAVEGCVGETTGAVLATWQSRHATDLRIRAAMKTIARDETRHAVLAWQVHAWGRERLGHHALDRAVGRALENVCIPHGIRSIGLPSRASAARLRAEVRARLAVLL